MVSLQYNPGKTEKYGLQYKHGTASKNTVGQKL